MKDYVSREYSENSGEIISKKIINLFPSLNCLKVSIFISKYPEISTIPLIKELFANPLAEVYIPAWQAEEMWMCKVDNLEDFNEICNSAPLDKIPMPTKNRVDLKVKS